MKENWQWKKAIAGILSAFTLLVGAGGLTSCEFGGGEQEEAEEQTGEYGRENEEGEENERDGDDD